MKILFSHYLLDDDNPPVRVNTAITSQLRELGHEVRLHRSAGPPIPVVQGQGGGQGSRTAFVQKLKNQVWFLKASMRNVGGYRRDVAVLREYNPDVVLVRHDAYCCSMAWAASRYDVPLVTYVDAPMSYETRMYHRRFHPPGLVEWMERQALKPSRELTATSHPTRNKVCQDFAIKVPITVIPNGIHPDRFPELKESDRLQRRRDMGIEAPIVIAFQGTFKPFHGVDRLRDIMIRTSHLNNVHWLLIGDGPELPSLRKAVAEKVRSTFLGRQPAELMGSLLGLTDIAVVPHHFVSDFFYLSPLKIIESAAAGCAVVAGRQGDIPWLLDDGRAGVLVSSPDLDEWIKAIETLVDDPQRCRELGRAARRYVMERFTWRQIAIQYAQVLERTVESSRATSSA